MIFLIIAAETSETGGCEAEISNNAILLFDYPPLVHKIVNCKTPKSISVIITIALFPAPADESAAPGLTTSSGSALTLVYFKQITRRIKHRVIATLLTADKHDNFGFFTGQPNFASSRERAGSSFVFRMRRITGMVANRDGSSAWLFQIYAVQ